MSDMTMDQVLTAMGLDLNVLEVDKHNLDNEFQRHPATIAEAAAAVARARRVRDEVKLDLVRVVARVRREIMDTNSGKRVLVKDLELSIDADPEVRQAERAVSNADVRVGQYDAVLQGLMAKTSALKHLSELYQAAYYVTSSAPSTDNPRTPGRRR